MYTICVGRHIVRRAKLLNLDYTRRHPRPVKKAGRALLILTTMQSPHVGRY